MTYKTHVLGGIVLAAGVVVATPVPISDAQAVTILCGGAIGAWLPDIDHTGAKISRSGILAMISSALISNATGHRGVTHTPLALLIVTVIGGILVGYSPGSLHSYPCLFYMGMIPGILSHLILDSLNPGGIMWAYPVRKKHYSVMSIKTGSMWELLLMGILFVLDFMIIKSVLNVF